MRLLLKQSTLAYLKSVLKMNLTLKMVSRRPTLFTQSLFVKPDELVGIMIAVDGLYERAQLESLASLLRSAGTKTNEMIALDVGASVGNHSIFFSGLFKQVLSFEPIPAVHQALIANKMLCGRGNITAFNIGLADVNGEADLFVRQNSGESSLLRSDESLVQRILRVPLRRGDEVLEEAKVDIKKVALIKIDVEGAEGRVVDGMPNLLRNGNAWIVFEAHNGVRAEEVASRLQRWGYLNYYAIGRAHEGRLAPLPKKIWWRITSGSNIYLEPIKVFEERYYAFLLATKESIV